MISLPLTSLKTVYFAIGIYYKVSFYILRTGFKEGEDMCRLFAITSETPVSPMAALEALDVMREGHDGSGVGLFLRDLGGPFEEMKDAPILSGIFSEAGIRRLDIFMMDIGFLTKYKLKIKVPKTPTPGVPRRDIYLVWQGV